MKPVKVLPGHVLRYAFTERLVHWAAALSYIYLLLSGLAFWTPWMWWVAMMLGGGPVSREVHPWMGLIFTAAMIYMLRVWLPDMRITKTDLEWKKHIREYVTNEDEEMHPVQAVAFLCTLAGFIIHVYMGTAVVRGGFSSVIRGEVTEGWARYHHRLWLERIEQSAKK